MGTCTKGTNECGPRLGLSLEGQVLGDVVLMCEHEVQLGQNKP